jgi:hypothetical protein
MGRPKLCSRKENQPKKHGFEETEGAYGEIYA